MDHLFALLLADSYKHVTCRFLRGWLNAMAFQEPSFDDISDKEVSWALADVDFEALIEVQAIPETPFEAHPLAVFYPTRWHQCGLHLPHLLSFPETSAPMAIHLL